MNLTKVLFCFLLAVPCLGFAQAPMDSAKAIEAAKRELSQDQDRVWVNQKPRFDEKPWDQTEEGKQALAAEQRELATGIRIKIEIPKYTYHVGETAKIKVTVTGLTEEKFKGYHLLDVTSPRDANGKPAHTWKVEHLVPKEALGKEFSFTAERTLKAPGWGFWRVGVADTAANRWISHNVIVLTIEP